MAILDRLDRLVADASFEMCGYHGLRPVYPSSQRFIHKAAVPGGEPVNLFKVLLTNVCINDCAYCANQAGRDTPRASFQPEELARLFIELHSRKLVHGLFLSSGISGNASRTMESMIKTVDILRRRHEYKGYIHLKILPGASFDCIEEGCKLASRVSVNMEAPSVSHLAKLTSKKDLYRDIVERMRWVKQLTEADDRMVPSGQTTQFVVGASGETDADILHTTQALYREIGLRRAYFSAFHPISRSPLEGLPPTLPLRQHRLYQADWLLRIYGFSFQEVDLALEGNNLPPGKDPKLTIAGKQPWLFPVDVNRASYDKLLRVPGIGPLSAARIIEARKYHSVFSLEQLRKMRVVIRQATPYIWFQDMSSFEKQASFFP